MNAQTKKPHYGLLDLVRGVCILSMVAYHAMYDLVNLKGFTAPWFHGAPGHVWQQSICWTFILLSGLCWQLSRRHGKRGLLLVGCGALITAVTYFVMPGELILYGVLNLLGLSALLLIPLDRLFQICRLPAWAGLTGALLLFFVLRGVPEGYLGFEGLRLFELPGTLYQFDALAVLGLPPMSFYSSDYFPLVPWFFLFLAGYFLWSLLSRSERTLDFLCRAGIRTRVDGSRTLFPLLRPFAFLGRHSLLIYLLHQPVLMGIFLLF